jgi:trimethyllysine dioxygenase
MDIKPTHVNYTPNDPTSITIKWNVNGVEHVSIFESDWLRNQGVAASKSPPKVLWDASSLTASNYPRISAPNVLNDCPNSSNLKHVLTSIRDYGLCVVHDMPPTMTATEQFARKIGFPKETIYGVMWDTHVKSDDTINDTAFSSCALALHTDCTYMRDPPGLQAFNCAKNSTKGGITRLMDGFKVADVMKHEYPESYKFFVNTSIPWWCKDVDHKLETCAPVIRLNSKGQYDLFRFNNDDRGTLKGLSVGEMKEFYHHLKVVQRLLRDPALEFNILLNPGTMILVDNQRVLHGRTAFEGTERNLLGFYMDRDLVESRMKVLGIAI